MSFNQYLNCLFDLSELHEQFGDLPSVKDKEPNYVSEDPEPVIDGFVGHFQGHSIVDAHQQHFRGFLRNVPLFPRRWRLQHHKLFIRSSNQKNFLTTVVKGVNGETKGKYARVVISKEEQKQLSAIISLLMAERESFRQENLFTDAALESCGFQIASRQLISKALYRVIPDGRQSVLYQAIQQGLNNLNNLNLMLEQSGTAHRWQLSLVVILSGHDQGSPIDWNSVLQSYRQVKRRLQNFKVVFVAYNVPRALYQQLFYLEGLDENQPVSLHMATSRQEMDGDQSISRLMQRIREQLNFNEKRGNLEGNLGEEAKSNPYSKDKNHGVMVIMSGTERYRGEPWTMLCNGVQTLLKPLGEKDLFGCLIYSDQVQQFWGDRFQPQQALRPVAAQMGGGASFAAPYNQPQEQYYYGGNQQLQAPLLPQQIPMVYGVPPAQNQMRRMCGIVGSIIFIAIVFIIVFVAV